MTVEEHYQRSCQIAGDIHEHLPTLRRYASIVKRVTEFGVRDVVSTWALLAGAPETVVSYDIAECLAVADIPGAINDSGYSTKFQFLQRDVREIQIAETDLLFIDTLHTYEQLSAELRLHAPKVGKFLVLHDTETFSDNGELAGTRGLRYAIDELLLAGRWRVREHFPNNNGLTILHRS